MVSEIGVLEVTSMSLGCMGIRQEERDIFYARAETGQLRITMAPEAPNYRPLLGRAQ